MHHMADPNTTAILGIVIPSADPAFLAIVGTHILFGLGAVIAGAIAMLSKKERGRHSISARYIPGACSGCSSQ